MLNLTVRAFYPHLLGYVVTFTMFGFLGAVLSRDPDYIITAGVFLVGWAAGPALFVFQQRAESERFLRTLPVTRGEIVTARFLAQLLLLAICWAVLLLMILTVPMTAEESGVCLKFTCAAIATSLVVAGLAYSWTAYRGPSILAGVLLNFVLVLFSVPFIVAHSRPGDTFDTRDTLFVSVVTGLPWIVQVVLPALGLWLFVLMMRQAAAREPTTDGPRSSSRCQADGRRSSTQPR